MIQIERLSLPLAEITTGTPELGSVLIFGAAAVLFLWIAQRRGFFVFPAIEWLVPVKLYHILGAFAIYFFGSMAAGTLFTALIKAGAPSDLLFVSSWFNFITSGLILVLLAIFWRAFPELKAIWVRPNGEPHNYTEDVAFAFIAWFVSFPVVLFMSNFFEYFISAVFHVTQLPDQLAVQFLKMTFGNPLYLFLAVGSIILFAPLLEELLFRGFLQTFIRKHLGPKPAVFLTSLCFAFFHYSADQGLGNISIIGSLFALALFLGFLYERQGSLLAPIALHASFNAISVLNLYFLGGIPGGI